MGARGAGLLGVSWWGPAERAQAEPVPAAMVSVAKKKIAPKWMPRGSFFRRS